jgi:hypothetical protein
MAVRKLKNTEPEQITELPKAKAKAIPEPKEEKMAKVVKKVAPVTKPTKKAKDKSKVKKEQTPTGYTQDLLLQLKFTDEQIHKKVMDKFGDMGAKTSFSNVSLVRSDINHGLQAKKKVLELGIDLPIPRYLKTDKGVVGVTVVKPVKKSKAAPMINDEESDEA